MTTHPLNKHHAAAKPAPKERKLRTSLTPRDMWKLCEQRARRDGVDLDDLVWSVMKGVILAGSKGNPKCANIVFDRLIGPVDRIATATQVNVAVDASQRHEGVGPPVPPPDVLVRQMQQLSHLLKSGGPVTVVDTDAEMEELLS